MKTIRYIVLGLVIVTLSLNDISGLFAQGSKVEFRETYRSGEITAQLDQDDRFYKLINANDTDPSSSLIGYCDKENASELEDYIQSKSFIRSLPDNVRFTWGVKQKDSSRSLYALKQIRGSKNQIIHKDILDIAVAAESDAGDFSLLISFNEKGAEKWANLTGKNVGRDIAIVIDGVVYSAPRVREKITMGKCQISGNFNREEIESLKNLLLSGQN
jgi:SecD/SecF fusion protein